jgi:signal transduction histidine kinase
MPQDQRLPLWTWILPVFVCHLGTQISLLTQIFPGYALFYLPVTFGTIMVLWWGPRVLLGVYVNAVLSAWLWDLQEWYLFPVYGFPETLEVFLIWFLYARWQKGKCWLPNLAEVLKYILWAVFVPITFNMLYLNLQFYLLEKISRDNLWELMFVGWLPEFVANLTVATAVLVFFTAWMEKRGLSLTRGAKVPLKIMPGPVRLRMALELGGFSLLILILSLTLPFAEYWFLFGLFTLYASLRLGFWGSLLGNAYVFLLTYILPTLFLDFYGIDWAPNATIVNVHLGMTLFSFSALAVGRMLNDFLEARYQLEKQNEALEAVNLGYNQELARRKEMESKQEELIQELENRNAEMESFTYTVSHDLKSPLITVSGFLYLLKEDIREGDVRKMEADLERIDKAVVMMGKLLDDLLELSRVGRIVNEPEIVDLNQLIGQVLEGLWKSIQTIRITIVVEENMPKVRVDKTRIGQVFQNLIENAIKFRGDQQEPRIEIGCLNRAGETVFFVRDNGIGIDPKHHEMVFELFHRLDTRVEGTGIGLALVKRIVEIHEGRIWFESEGKGQGTTFYFTLPLGHEKPGKRGGQQKMGSSSS